MFGAGVGGSQRPQPAAPAPIGTEYRCVEANGGKYNVKDWTEYLKKDLPKRRPNHNNTYAVQNILRSVE